MRPRPTGAALLGLALASCTLEEAPLEGFEIHPDFALERVAIEPVVMDPVDLEFDEQGRAYVLEMPGYPVPAEPGRVVRLDDVDGDGIWETRTLYAEGFPIADSILPYRGGLLVASPPDLLYLRDADGDGRAEQRRVVLSGFAADNTQHNFNGLAHGLDNWIYGANGGNSGEVFWPEAPEETLPLYDDDFRFDVEARELERYAHSAGGFGLSFDGWGRVYTTHNLYHVVQPVFPGRYLARLPGPLRSTREAISDHGEGPARIFPVGIPETRVNHPEQSGYFSGACGIAVYTGGAFGPGFDDQVFVADVVSNLVHRSAIRAQGARMVASRAREGVEFLASSDRAFRPVNLTVGPDGALYVLDMHRTVIEHPEWIPDGIEAGLDLRAGSDRGRIYRVTPRGGLPRASHSLARARPEQLVQALGHPNKWWRDTAQRLLVEQAETAPVPQLLTALRDPGSPHRRLHALWTLEGAGALPDEALVAALSDLHPRLREQALIVAEPRLPRSSSLTAAAVALAEDPDPRVRLQAVLTLGTLRDVPDDVLVRVGRRDAADPWTRRALLGALAGRPTEALARLGVPGSDGGLELARGLAGLVNGGVADVLALLRDRSPGDAYAAAILDGLATNLESRPEAAPPERLRPETLPSLTRLMSGAPGPAVRDAWRVARALGVAPGPGALAQLRAAGAAARDPAVPVGERLQALALFELEESPARLEALLALLGPDQPLAIQDAAMEQLARSRHPDVGAGLLEAWPRLGPGLRARAAEVLIGRRQDHRRLLAAVETGRVSLGELNLHLERRRALLRSRDEDVRRRAEALFSDAGVVTRAEALERMRPALTATGRPAAGRRHYRVLCARCHRLGEEGVPLGPDLHEVARKSPETLLHDIVDPNAAVETRDVSYSVETRDGRLLTGLLRNETDADLEIVAAGGEATRVRRDEIERLWTGGLSLMPEELELGLEPQDLADLLAYLRSPS
jgi:putative membrane-bound dehydrogenase-like protein